MKYILFSPSTNGRVYYDGIAVKSVRMNDAIKKRILEKVETVIERVEFIEEGVVI
ncbi:MAG: hypothetical protein WAV32_05760 [Halobacteriota archaeon]